MTLGGCWRRSKGAMIDLNPNHLRTVRRILTDHVPTCEVRAFGSRATWNAKDYSDLDLAIVGAEPLNWGTLGRLKEAYEESDLPIRVDVLDWYAISESFREVIERDYVVLQNGSSGDGAGLPGEWHEMPFSKAVLVNPTVRLDRNVTYPFVDMAAVNADSRSAYPSEQREFRGGGSRFHSGDTLMARITPCLENGKIARYHAPEAMSDAHGSTEFIVIRGRPNVTDNDFAYYLTQWNEVREYAISQMTGTSGRQRVPVGSLNHLNVPIPPLLEQRAIAHVLGTLDDKIELNRRMNETLEEMARSLFKSWFVDFEPVRAKMERRETGLPPDIADLFPDRLVASELGEIPDGWEVKGFEEFATVVYGAAFSSKRFNDSGLGLPLIRIRDLAAHNPSVFTDQEHPRGHLIKPADIVVGMDGEFRAHIWKGPSAWLNQRVCHFEPRPGIPTAFLLEALSSSLAYFERAKVGTTVIHLSKGDIDSIRLIRPTEVVLNAFAQMSEPLSRRIVDNALESRKLAAQRDTLLPKLMSGEVGAKGGLERT